MTILDWSETKARLAGYYQDYSRVVCDKEGVTLNWRGEYFISWLQLRERGDLVGWCHHLLEKGWFTPLRCRIFIEQVCAYRDWRVGP